ncbi:MAG TPA: hypothetical protein PLJ12_01875 [Planctomycetota bacterium]|nr:hypothetical protein [Planctomycetota bacterium]
MKAGAGPLRLRAQVAFARRAWGQLLLAEGLILAVFVAFCLLYLALRSGAKSWEGDPLALATVGALLGAILWVYECWRTEGEVARHLDQRLGLRGRLLAGLQAEQIDPPSEMGMLLVEGLRTEVSRRAIWTRALPVKLWLVALPFLSGALLLQGVEAKRSHRIRWHSTAPSVEQLGQLLQQSLAEVESRAGTQATAQTLQSIERSVRSMALDMELGRSDASEWAPKLESMAESLDQVAESFAGDPALDSLLDRAQGELTWIRQRTQDSLGADTSRSSAPIVSGGVSTGATSAEPAPRPGGGAPGTEGEALVGPTPRAEAEGVEPSVSTPGGPDSSLSAPEVDLGSPAVSSLRLVPPRVPREYRALISRWHAGESAEFR